jgi:AraC family transcriptional regulator
MERHSFLRSNKLLAFIRILRSCIAPLLLRNQNCCATCKSSYFWADSRKECSKGSRTALTLGASPRGVKVRAEVREVTMSNENSLRPHGVERNVWRERWGQVHPEMRHFEAEILSKQAFTWTAGKSVSVDRQPRAGRTDFKHCHRWHTIALHTQGANSQTELWYNRGSRHSIGSTLGRLMLIPACRELEGWSNYQERTGHVFVLLNPSAIDSEQYEGTKAGFFDLPFCAKLNDGFVASRMRALNIALKNSGQMSRLHIDILSCEIWIHLLRRFCQKPIRAPRGGLSSHRLRQISVFIEENLGEDIGLVSLAQLIGYSQGHFCRAFRESMGISPHQYIIQRRVELAKRLLVSNDNNTIADVALACGFGSQSLLTKHFHAAVGTTPWRFRKA